MDDLNEFRLTADCTFMAHDMDDAMLKLAKYFLQNISVWGESSNLLPGDIRVRPRGSAWLTFLRETAKDARDTPEAPGEEEAP